MTDRCRRDSSWHLVAAGVLPPFDPPWITHVVALGFLLCVALTIAASVQPVANWISLHRDKRAREAIPFMTEQERAIRITRRRSSMMVAMPRPC